LNVEKLVDAGIDHTLADDIVRRINAVELKRLELQNNATREGYLDTPRYYDELAAINRQDINLRDELGDDLYDTYLYNSKQTNRVKIESVMLGSAAELSGIKQGDVVFSYDNKRIFTWDELKTATTEGNAGEYIFISVYRNGEIFSFSVPRGPLGVQLGSMRMEP
jgi:S1-C subfamily serine protease